MRSAQLPPPGLYGGSMHVYAEANEFFDGDGKSVPALKGLDLRRMRHGPFIAYVPNVEILGGSIGLLGLLPVGTECGRLFTTTSKSCIHGVGDAYIELTWSRFFGSVRPSMFASAPPVLQGLTVAAGVGVVVPIGRYKAETSQSQGLLIGNNLWDVAPNVAFTYMTRPLLFDGTELSAKVYLNTYGENPDTHYKTGSLVNIDFALTERIGRAQLGLAGFYAFQIADDELHGVPVSPDGMRGKVLHLGGVIGFDMPEHGASLKVKALTSVVTENAVHSSALLMGWIKKF
ncbi:MAG: transporter [Hyphomicrobiaceae bacterium]